MRENLNVARRPAIDALGGIAALAAGAAVSLCAPACAEPTPPGYSVKAVFLTKFPPFVQWPDAAFDSQAGPFNICVLGADPFGPALDQAVSGQHAGQHPLAVKRLSRADRSSGCQILYLGGAKGPAAADALAALKGAPVLTVSEESRHDVDGCVLTFALRDNRVRFSIDAQAARQGGLTISSKLLSLAISVRPVIPAEAR